jgi:hypothetical protein
LTIRPGRARIYFNQQTYPKAFGTKREGKNNYPAIAVSATNPNYITEIPICAGAVNVAVAAGLAFITASLF